MAATLKLGDRQWATKEGSLLAYNDENNNFKPLPFDFTRASSATRVNQQGLIETVASGVPRIDYTDANGALKLEPQRTNLLPYSTLDFNGGVKPNGWSIGFGTGSYSYEQLEYKGQKAVKQTQITTGRSYLDTGTITILANTVHTLKIQFILDECIADPNDFIVSFIGFGSSGNYQFSDIDSNGILEVQYNPITDNIGNLRIGLGAIGNVDGGKSLAWAIPQLESGSYATSYIPTSGSAVTRIADGCSQTVPDGIIGQTEGSVYVEVNISNTTSKTILALDTGSASNFIILDTSSSLSPKILVRQSSGSFPAIITGTTMSYGVNKIAFCYKSGDYAMYVNGVLSGTSTSTTFPSGIIRGISVGANSSYGYLSDTVNDVKLYNTRLSNAELQALTTI